MELIQIIVCACAVLVFLWLSRYATRYFIERRRNQIEKLEATINEYQTQIKWIKDVDMSRSQNYGRRASDKILATPHIDIDTDL